MTLDLNLFPTFLIVMFGIFFINYLSCKEEKKDRYKIDQIKKSFRDAERNHDLSIQKENERQRIYDIAVSEYEKEVLK